MVSQIKENSGSFESRVDEQAPRIRVTENYFSYFSTKTYVVGTQKNHLDDETVLLSTQNTCLN